jgi:hypothetical protein
MVSGPAYYHIHSRTSCLLTMRTTSLLVIVVCSAQEHRVHRSSAPIIGHTRLSVPIVTGLACYHIHSRTSCLHTMWTILLLVIVVCSTQEHRVHRSSVPVIGHTRLLMPMVTGLACYHIHSRTSCLLTMRTTSLLVIVVCSTQEHRVHRSSVPVIGYIRLLVPMVTGLACYNTQGRTSCSLKMWTISLSVTTIVCPCTNAECTDHQHQPSPV